MNKVTLQTGLVVANLVAWCALVMAREPVNQEYFARHDKWRHGELDLSSSDPPVVLAGRPLWYWSQYHGGEHLAVKILEVANCIPLVFICLAGLVVGALAIMPTYARSHVAFASLLLLTSAQWWAVGSILTALHHRMRRT